MIAGRVNASIIRAMFWCVFFAAIARFVVPLSVLARIPTITRIAVRGIRLFQLNEAVAEYEVVGAR